MQEKKYRPLAKGTLRLVRRKYRKRKVDGKPLDFPCIYLCRHRDMIGVVQAFSDIKTVLRVIIHDFGVIIMISLG